MPALTFDEFLTGAPVNPNAPKGITFEDVLNEREILDQVDRRNQEMRAGRTNAEADAHAVSLTGRIVGEGAVSGALGAIAAPADAIVGVGRDIAYGAKKGLSKIGVTEAPDPKNYFYEGDQWPMTSLAIRAGRAIPDALGLDHPETPGERVVSATGQGAVGALTGVGLGRLISRAGAPQAGSLLADNPVAQTVAGAASGAAAATARELGANDTGATVAGLGGSVLPMLLGRVPGRQTIDSPEGVRSAAGELLRRQADNPEAAAMSATSAEASRAVTPGYRILGTEATRDPGIGAIAKNLEDWSNGAPGVTRAEQIREGNSAALSEGLDRFGGARGRGATTRREQNSRDAAAIGNLNLGQIRDVEVGHILTHLDQRARGVNSSDVDVSAASQVMRDQLRSVATPVYGINPRTGRREITNYTVNGNALHNLRRKWGKAANDKMSAMGGDKDNAALYAAGGETRGNANLLADELDALTSGRYRSEFLEPSAAGRRAADNQTFMEDFKESVQPTGSADRNIREDTWLSNVRTRADRKLPGGRNMTYDDLDPMRQSYLAGGAADIEKNQFSKSRQERGPVRQNRKDLYDDLQDVVQEGQGPIRKAAAPILKALDLGAADSRRLNIPGTGLMMRGLSHLGRVSGTDRFARQQRAVQNVVAGGVGDPAEMAALLRTSRAYNPGPQESAYLALRRGARGAASGFLASERTKRYR